MQEKLEKLFYFILSRRSIRNLVFEMMNSFFYKDFLSLVKDLIVGTTTHTWPKWWKPARN